MSQADVATMAVTAAMPVAADPVRGAISRAAQSTGVDFSYLLAQARLESSLNPAAHAATSSAAGLYQFTKGTWSAMLARHGAELGLGNMAGGGGLTAAAAPTSRMQLMALRYNPDAAAMMAARLAGDNTAALSGTLGRTPNASELYLAHFLGLAGATRFLSALAGDPGQPAVAVLPQAAAANHTVFFDGVGAPRSVAQVMALIDGRMATALGQTHAAGLVPTDAGIWQPPVEFDPAIAATAPATAQPGAGPLARQFAAAQSATPAADDDAVTASGPSMAETLLTTFGEGVASGVSDADGRAGAAPQFVRSAYGQMQAWGL